jgi:serine/threonine-protein kinase
MEIVEGETLGYMSPEQCGGQGVDHRADVYSLGCVLMESLTGTPPFIGDNAFSTMMQHQNEPAPTLREASMGREFPEGDDAGQISCQ